MTLTTLGSVELIVTVPVPVRPPLTVKALAAGTEPVSSLALKVSVRAVPLTAAEASVGAAGAPWTPITRERALVSAPQLVKVANLVRTASAMLQSVVLPSSSSSESVRLAAAKLWLLAPSG